MISNMTSMGADTFVFDLATGQLVGIRRGSDIVERCPFGGDAGWRTLSAGEFPATSCARTGCRNGSPPSSRYCPDAEAIFPLRDPG